MTRCLLIAALSLTAICIVAPAMPARAAEPVLADLHFLIPAGPGGGLDSTARALGRAVAQADLADTVSFENMTGGGGGRAMGHFIQTAPRQQNTLLVNSSPLLVRSLQGLFPHSWRDLAPVAGVIAEWSVLAVRTDSALSDFESLAQALRANPRRYTIGGGSVRGSFDHIAVALVLEEAGVPVRAARYLPYDGGGKAMLALLGGEVDVLSTGLGEVLGYVASGDVRVLGVTAPERVDVLPDTPTLTQLGYPVVLGNWRGVFAAPGTPPERLAQFEQVITRAVEAPAWRESLERYGWRSQVLHGEEFVAYLTTQEKQLGSMMRALGFVR